jgi:hypothetical protein
MSVSKTCAYYAQSPCHSAHAQIINLASRSSRSLLGLVITHEKKKSSTSCPRTHFQRASSMRKFDALLRKCRTAGATNCRHSNPCFQAAASEKNWLHVPKSLGFSEYWFSLVERPRLRALSAEVCFKYLCVAVCAVYAAYAGAGLSWLRAS